jgi:GxxExxY protein
MPTIIHKELSYKVRGVLLSVHNTLGPNLPERFYCDATAYGLEAEGIQCETEKSFEVFYRDVRVGLYRVDVWVENGKIVLELKVAPEILPLHRGQAISYLKVTDADLAIVVSFGAGSLLDERLPNFLREKAVNFQWKEHPVADDTLYPELTNRCFEVLHRVYFELGPGFLHQVYRRATMVELEHQGLSYDYIKRVPIFYQDHYLGQQPARLINVEGKVLLATVAVRASRSPAPAHCLPPSRPPPSPTSPGGASLTSTLRAASPSPSLASPFATATSPTTFSEGEVPF